MKRVEKLILALLVAAALKSVCHVLYTQWYLQWCIDQMNDATLNGNAFPIWTSRMLPAIPGIVCAAWLSFEAKSEKLTTWVWLLFGLVFRLEAIIIFYAYSILKHIKQESQNKVLEGTSQ